MIYPPLVYFIFIAFFLLLQSVDWRVKVKKRAPGAFGQELPQTKLVVLRYAPCFDTIAALEITRKTAWMPNTLLMKVLPREHLTGPDIKMVSWADLIIEWQ
jgi:hypothetical protein